MKRQTIVLLTLLLLTTVTFGQDEKIKEKHPIDIQLEKCHSIDSNQTTYSMIQCEVIARDAWDSEMNKYYQLLMSILQADEKAKLKAAQVSWLTYHNKEKEFSRTVYYNLQGTMWRVIAAGRACEILKQRTLELKAYYDTLTFDK